MIDFGRCHKCSGRMTDPWHILNCQAVLRQQPEQISLIEHNVNKLKLTERGKFRDMED